MDQFNKRERPLNSPVRYGDHIPFLERELEALGRNPFDLSFGSFLEVLAHPGTDEADVAVRAFAATLCWPPLTDRVRLELCLRLSCAKFWCNECRDADVEDEEGNTFLEQVLIDYWRDEGRLSWLHETYCMSDQSNPGSG